MNIQLYFNKLKDLHIKLLEFIENDDDEKDYFKELINFVDQIHIIEDPYEFKLFLQLISAISNNHQRQENFISKLERIILQYKDEIKQTFSNFTIFNIFYNNRSIILSLSTNGILTIDETITKFIKDNCIRIFDLTNQNDEEYIQKCKLGVNESPLCQLIRDDSIDDFIVYVNQNNVPLFDKVKVSKFESNLLLIKNRPTLIEYAAFYGSIQIFKYLYNNKVELESSLWLYSIHSRNPEILNFLEENQVKPKDDDFLPCLIESIKCHHNEIATYIKENYMNDYDDILNIETCLEYRNFQYFMDNYSIDQFNNYINEYFYSFCRLDFITLTEYYLQEMKSNNKFTGKINLALKDASKNNNTEIIYLILQQFLKFFKSTDATFSRLLEIKLPSSMAYIPDYFFYNAYVLTSISLPSTIKSIGKYAFSGCNQIKEIEIPPLVTRIEERTFDRCKSLTKVTIPNSVTFIGKCAFEYCISLKIISIPSCVDTIEKGAFYRCCSLEEITLPPKLQKIEVSLFNSCKMLKEISIPPLVTNIGSLSFANCELLKRVIFEDSQSKGLLNYFNHLFSKFLPNYSSIDKEAFKNCKSLEQISIPSIYRNIGSGAFEECVSLSKVDLPSNLLNMDSDVFLGCKLLKEITIPNSVKTIGERSFCRCSSLQSIVLPPSLQDIKECTFSDCDSLKQVTIPSSVIKIDKFAFNCCKSLRCLSLPLSVTSIGKCAFCECESLVEITIPSPSASIDIGAFRDCRSLSSVYISSKNLRFDFFIDAGRTANVNQDIIHFIDQ